MREAFVLGGWGMYPTTIIGLLLLAAAGRYARSPERRQLGTVISLGLMTLLAGSLGFVTGVIRTLISATSGRFPEPPLLVAMTGIGESLHNVGLALVLLVLATIGTTIGSLRAPR